VNCFYFGTTEQRLAAPELEELIGQARTKEFLKCSNELYRTRHCEGTSRPRAQGLAIQLMAKEPNLIRRGGHRGSQSSVGFDGRASRKLMT